jgi:hypothetical protein
MIGDNSFLVRLLGSLLPRRSHRFISSLLCAGMVALATGEVSAHDHNHPELDSWFRSLHAKDGAWCCDGNDAEIADWDMQDGHYRVRIDEQWVDVPEGSVVEGPNKVGGARVWPYYTSGRPNVRCFLPGSMT